MDDILRQCTCGKLLRHSQVQYLGESMDLYWFNCPFCHSTLVAKVDSQNGEAFAAYMQAATAGLKNGFVPKKKVA